MKVVSNATVQSPPLFDMEHLSPSRPASTPSHPFDMPTAQEIETAVGIFLASEAAKAGEKPWFSYAKLMEPPKELVRGAAPGAQRPPRVIRLVGTDRIQDGGFEADVEVGPPPALLKVSRIPGDAQACMNFRDIINATKTVKNDVAWNAAIQKRGLDPAKVECECWPAGGYTHPSIPTGHRAWRCLFFVKNDATDNCYARPVHGLLAHVDVTDRKIAHLEDHGAQKLPPDDARFDAAHNGPARTDLKPIMVTQPQGVSFEVNGHNVKWAGWEFHVSLHPIHGLVLHELSLHGRPILYRASMSDMVVPYADSDPMHNWKHVLDSGEVTIVGASTNSLKLGCDCLGQIHYFDLSYVNFQGKVVTVEKAICMHEEDDGIQWKTKDMRTQLSETRRGRKLVLSSFSTVGNYDYGWYWHLFLDGEIEVEVKLTGILSVGGGETADPEFAPIVARNLAAPIHQHLFCFRLDWDLDGGPNSLVEDQIEISPANAPGNLDGNQFRNTTRMLENESSAKRVINPEKNRVWKILNRNKMNSLGKPVAYKVIQGTAQRLFASEGSAVARRAPFAKYNLWATPYAPEEIYAAGEHCVLSTGAVGLDRLTSKNRSIVDCDLVTWHTIGVTHVPRPEDWPVMPVEKASLRLKPVGFFDRSPVMNLPDGCHVTSGSIQSKL